MFSNEMLRCLRSCNECGIQSSSVWVTHFFTQSLLFITVVFILHEWRKQYLGVVTVWNKLTNDIKTSSRALHFATGVSMSFLLHNFLLPPPRPCVPQLVMFTLQMDTNEWNRNFPLF